VLMEFLHVHGDQIVTREGQPVRLRGFNLGGWLNMEDYVNGFPGAEHVLRETMERIAGTDSSRTFFDAWLAHFFTEADVARMAALGANVLRLPFNYRHFERDDRPFEYLEEGFRRLEQTMDWCARYGLYVILDCHAAQGWHNPDWHADNAHMQVLLFTHKHFQDRFAALWREIARRFTGNPAVAGYALLNEPVTRLEYERYKPSFFDWDGLNNLYRRAAAAIREVDREHMLFLEGDDFSSEYAGLDVRFDDNIVLSLHNYIEATDCDGEYPGLVASEYWDKERVARRFHEHSGTLFARQHGLPVLVGEFGALTNIPEAQSSNRIAAMRDQLETYEAAGAHWTIWTFKDIGIRRGVFLLNPESEYRRLIEPVLRARRAFADWNHESGTAAGRSIVHLINTVDDRLSEFGFPIDRKRFKQYMLFGYNAHLLQVAFARLFSDKSPAEIDRLLQSFAIEACTAYPSVLDLLKKYFKPTIGAPL
jgi:endoglucanase